MSGDTSHRVCWRTWDCPLEQGHPGPCMGWQPPTGGGLRYLVTKRRTDVGPETLASAYLTDTRGLIELARRVCPLDHLHDTAEQAQACTASPVDTDCEPDGSTQ